MSTSSWNWAGARWWKFDFHTHTPASHDYGKGPDSGTLMQRTPREWLLDFMRAGIDCVAVTDHNSGAWVDRLKVALAQLEDEKPAGYRPLVLFPGVEISVNGGVHLLAILNPDTSTADIDSLLGAAGFSGTKGSSDAVTSRSFCEVVSAISSAGGLAIPAHVDGPSGLFTSLRGTTLEQAFACHEIVAMEMVDSNASKPPLYEENSLHWTAVLGSDAHHPEGGAGQRYPGSHFTWVKMGSPSLEGLRLALVDGPLSVRRSDTFTGDPNGHAAIVVESIEVENARYMGRDTPLKIDLNPWLNAIIGGRGTGKSTLVELLRIILRREAEIPQALAEDYRKYRQVYESRNDDGLLTDTTNLAVVYRKDGARFRIRWSPSGAVEPIQEDTGDGSWKPAAGDVAQRFPVRIFSQKQIYQLAKAPGALLRVVDQAPEVERHQWDQRWEQEERRFLSLRAKAREIEAGLSEEPRLRGELDDIKRKLAVFAETGHAAVLTTFQRRRQQQRAVESWQEGWQQTGQGIRDLAAAIVPDPLEVPHEDEEAKEDRSLLELAERIRGRLDGIRQELEETAARADGVLNEWNMALGESAWKERVDSATQAYEDLNARLADEGVSEPAAYGTLVQQRQVVEQRLRKLADRRKQAEATREQARESSSRLQSLRRELTTKREQFLASVLHGNQYVRISVLPYGARETVEEEVRRILGRDGAGFERDIGTPDGEGGLLASMYAGGSDAGNIEARLDELKQTVRGIAAEDDVASSVRDRRFADYLRKLPPETFDRLDLWFPEDSLDVQYSATSDGRRFRSIQDGSPGQKTAALLAFLLSYGEEPLILDQPEDDLDNHLIYSLIVSQLRTVKQHRQLVVVTHNPNIVVNGDAELVIGLHVKNGQTCIETSGSLQEAKVRGTICTVMEGGREAFESRYRRIVMEGSDV